MSRRKGFATVSRQSRKGAFTVNDVPRRKQTLVAERVDRKEKKHAYGRFYYAYHQIQRARTKQNQSNFYQRFTIEFYPYRKQKHQCKNDNADKQRATLYGSDVDKFLHSVLLGKILEYFYYRFVRNKNRRNDAHRAQHDFQPRRDFKSGNENVQQSECKTKSKPDGRTAVCFALQSENVGRIILACGSTVFRKTFGNLQIPKSADNHQRRKQRNRHSQKNYGFCS